MRGKPSGKTDNGLVSRVQGRGNRGVEGEQNPYSSGTLTVSAGKKSGSHLKGGEEGTEDMRTKGYPKKGGER